MAEDGQCIGLVCTFWEFWGADWSAVRGVNGKRVVWNRKKRSLLSDWLVGRINALLGVIDSIIVALKDKSNILSYRWRLQFGTSWPASRLL
jgi:hypothetical protein